MFRAGDADGSQGHAGAYRVPVVFAAWWVKSRAGVTNAIRRGLAVGGGELREGGLSLSLKGFYIHSLIRFIPSTNIREAALCQAFGTLVPSTSVS